MKKINLQARTHKKKRNSYRKTEECLIWENLVKQSFSANCKNKICLGDITYIPVAGTNIYLATFIDIFTRKVIGWTVSNRINEDLVISALGKVLVAEKFVAALTSNSISLYIN